MLSDEYNWYNYLLGLSSANFSSLSLVLLEGLFVILFLFNYSYKKRDEKIESAILAVHSFSTRWTIYLQDLIGTRNIVAWFLSAYYIFGFTSSSIIAILFFIIVLDSGRVAQLEIYLIVIITMWIIDTGIYYLYPVKPPVRFKTRQNFVDVRNYYFSWSDRMIGIKYNALPSGHIWILTTVWVASVIEGLPFFTIFFAVNLVIACIVILFTGDHYPIDIISSILLVMGLYLLIWLMLFIFG